MVKHQWIPWPLIGQIDKHEIAPIVNNYYFCRLADKRQMGLAYLIFPGATHDRRQHSMGAYFLTDKFTSRMVEQGVFSKKQALNLNLYALLHDIGHGPLSHVVEAATKINHKENGLKIVDLMAGDIARCGGDLELIKSYMRKDDTTPEWRVVSDKNFGMEKMDYLVRDQEVTEFGPNIRHCVESVFNHLTYKDGQLVVDLKAIDAAIEIQRAYNYFYRNVYLEKSTYITQRFVQKLIFQLLNTSAADGGVTEEELWDMVDGELLYTLKKCKNETVRNGMNIFKGGVPLFPKTALSIRLNGFGFLERRSGKPIHMLELDKKFFDKFFDKSNARDLEQLESAIAKLLGIESWKVCISHIIEKHRFVPQDIAFSDGQSTYSLKEKEPSYFELLERELDKYLCIRVCVVPEHRLALFDRWSEVLNIICQYIGYDIKPLSN